MSMIVQKGNYERFVSQTRLVRGIGQAPSGSLFLEVESATGPQRYLIRVESGRAKEQGKIEHVCEAVKKRVPCWHLAAALEAVASLNRQRQEYPARVRVEAREPEPEPVRDVTPEVLGRPGEFRFLEATDDLPELPSSCRWLARYRLPVPLLRKVLAFREKQERTLPEEARARVPEPRYVPAGSEVARAVAALLYGPGGRDWEPVLLKGPRGSGKSTLADTLGAILSLPVVRITGGIDVDAEWLLGSRTLAYDAEGRQRVVHEPGLLLRAVEEGALLVVEEVNMLLPEVTSLLHSLLDWQRVLPVPGVGYVRPPRASVSSPA